MMSFYTHAAEGRVTTMIMFALYLITSVQIVRYSKWIAAGQPNPFLPGQPRAVPASARPRLRQRDADLKNFRVY